MTLNSDKKNLPLVSICCTTYNHEPYISSAIEGILMQKTTFPIEIIIHDDASTDKTAEIVKEYAEKNIDLIIPILQTTNQYSRGLKPSVTYVYPRTRGKYIATCEGDDYWTDPFKLQKQVDFLESNEQFGLVYTEIDRRYEKTKIIEKNAFSSILGIHSNTYKDLLANAQFLAPCTWLFRRKLLDEYKYSTNWPVGDYPRLLWISRQSKIHFLRDTTAVYRVLPQSASHHSSLKTAYKFRKGIFNIQNYFLNLDPLDEKLQDDIRRNFYIPYFSAICIHDDKEFKKQALTYIKEKQTISIFNRLSYQLSLNPVSLWVLKNVYYLYIQIKIRHFQDHFRKR